MRFAMGLPWAFSAVTIWKQKGNWIMPRFGSIHLHVCIRLGECQAEMLDFLAWNRTQMGFRPLAYLAL